MKFKPKLLFKKALTIVGVLLTTTALTITALAETEAVWLGVPDSYINTTYTKDMTGVTYGCGNSGFKMSWRVTVYVAKSDDGTIDPTTDKITNNRLGYVGTIVYDNFQDGRNVYLQSTQYTELRLAEIPTGKYPYVSEVTSNEDTIQYSNSLHTDANGAVIPIYHSTENCGLPSLAADCSASAIKTTAESPAFASNVIKNINNFLGGTEHNLAPLYKKVLSDLGSEPLQKIKAFTGADKYGLMLPTKPDGSVNTDCVVEWVCVVEPIVELATLRESSFFDAYGYDFPGHTVRMYCGLGPGGDILGIDAYSVAQYNENSKTNYANYSFLEYTIRRKIPGFEPSHTWSGYTYEYSKYGKLYAEFLDNLNLCASSNYDAHPGYDFYCGVPVAGEGVGSSFSYKNNPAFAAKCGGISVYKTELSEDDSIPVYYYMYDDKNQPTGEVKTDSYTPADTGFVPKQDYGIPVADESLSNTDKPLVSKQGKQMYFYYKEYPDLAANVVDYKGTSAESEWRNPKAITTPIKTSKTVSGTETKAKSIHVKVIQPPSVQVVYHVYNYVVPDEDYDSIKSLTGSALENAVKDLTPTVSSSNKSIVLSETNKSYKASTDTSAKSYGTPIHVTATLAGKEAPLADAHCPDYCEPGERNWITSASSPKVYKPNGSAVFRADPTTVVNFNDEATGTGTRQIHVKIINVKQAPPLGESARDRIKTYDVTQYINHTISGVTGSQHLTTLTSGDNKGSTDNYNNSVITYECNSTHDKTEGAWLVSKPLTFSVNKTVDSLTYVLKTHTTHTIYTGSHTYEDTHTKSDGTKYTDKHTHNPSDSLTQYKCHKTQESVKTAFGVSVEQIQKSKVKNLGYTNWDTWPTKGDPAVLAANNKFNTVGFTIPKDYYADPDVIKLYGSGKDTRVTDYDEIYLLPDISKNKNHANNYATFDLLFDSSKNEYRIEWYEGNTQIKYQSDTSDDIDKFEDYTENYGDMSFKYTSGCNKNIDGAKYIAHRDLLTGNEVSPSLAVSGYMTKYAKSSQTFDYLKFMKECGFAFKGVNEVSTLDNLQYTMDTGTIGHENRTIWVANEAALNNLGASSNGQSVSSYNTDYTKPTANQYKVRFGLGGVSDDSVNMYTKYIKNSSELKDEELEDETEKGDALRSIYYYADWSDPGCGSSYSCDKHWASSSHSVSCHGHSSGTCSHSPVHKDNSAHPTAIANNNYLATAEETRDKYLTKGIYSGETVYTKTQTDMFEDIFTSREAFYIPLAVEGTIAGQWDPTNANGLNYNDKKLELKNKVLVYKENPSTGAKEEKTWREPTFELVQTHYSDVGSTDNNRTKNHSEVLAEFRYSIPTQTFKFNPSYYMQFDKGFEQEKQNQSVWMLSNQPRELNFKDILDIRLTQAVDNKNNSHATDITKACEYGYATVINSEWSTDKNDLTVQHATGIPTLKAGNAYTTSTEEQGGSITMYVVLQDPEFVSASRAADVETYNNQVMQSYKKTVKSILDELGAVATNTSTYTNRTDLKSNRADYKLGLAMYTNMENGSSVNSAMQIHTNKSLELKDKEPMVINSKGKEKFSYKSRPGILAESNNPTSADFSNWTFYALQGNTFKAMLNGDTYQELDSKQLKTDISETAAMKGDANPNRVIKIGGTTSTVYSMANTDIPYYVKNTLDMYNDRLTGIMSAPQYPVSGTAKKTGDTTFPTTYKPYLSTDITSIEHQFDWYGEDYEGFVVAVYNIEFDMYTEGAYALTGGKYQAVIGNGTTTTDQSAAFRHESDWRAQTNADADLSKYGKTEGASMHYLETPDYQLSGVEYLYANSKNNNLEFSKNSGKIMLITPKGQETLKNWSEGKKADGTSMDADVAKVFKDTYAEGIYGVGMELANVPIHMINNNVDGKKMEIGDNNSQASFFYQPTYFNIRGSVYDTAR